MSETIKKSKNSRARFEQWSRNPSCSLNQISAVYGLSMPDIIKKNDNSDATRKQSTFALLRGKMFEGFLLKENAKEFKKVLEKNGVSNTNTKYSTHDFRLKRDGGTISNIEIALEKTSTFLSDMGNKTPGENEMVILTGPVVVIPGSEIMLPRSILIIDILILMEVAGSWVAYVGEVKTYPDKSGYTDKSSLSIARSQAGVYVHALKLVLAELKSNIQVSSKGFLVLSEGGTYFASLRWNEDFKYTELRAKEGFEKLRKIADEMKPLTESEVIDKIKIAEINYSENCLSFCDRASICRNKIEKLGNPEYLGSDMRKFLNGKITLHRTIELLDGADPQSAFEVELVKKIKKVA